MQLGRRPHQLRRCCDRHCVAPWRNGPRLLQRVYWSSNTACIRIGCTTTSTTTGNPLGIWGNTSVYGNTALFLPQGYVSGATLSATATWDGQTLSTLGLNPGTYVYTWGSGPTADSLTVDVVSPQAVPEPTTLWVALIGGVAIFAHCRHGRRKTRKGWAPEWQHGAAE